MAKKKPDVWMPLVVGAYLADTTHLSRDQHGGYLLLLMAAWMAGGELPDNDEHLAQIVKATVLEWKKRLRPILAKFFVIEDGVWRQKRLLMELANATEKRAKWSAKARTASAARWGNPVDKSPQSIAPSNAQGIQDGMHSGMLGGMHKVSPIPLKALSNTLGLGSTDIACARADDGQANPHPVGDKSPKKKATPMSGSTAPPRPARGVQDREGIEALARYFGKWPLQGRAGHDWGDALDFVNRLRAEHFRSEQA